MDSFYTIVVVVAIAILIMTLIGIGIMLQAQNESVAFPLYATQCPDGWTVDGSGCTLPVAFGHPNYPTKTGIITDTDMIQDLSNSVVYSGPSKLYTTSVVDRKMTFNPVATTCQKRLWANDYSVTWDGVSNYNKCV
jgi:hypothetical protein